MFVSRVSLADQSVTIEVPTRLRTAAESVFELAPAGDGGTFPRISVRQDSADRYLLRTPFGDSIEDLDADEAIAQLLQEVVRALVYDRDNGVAIHTGAVGWRDQVVLVAGPTRAGKSSLVAWLASNGFEYLSDELAISTGEGRAEAFFRPLIVKPGSRDAVAELSFAQDAEAIELGENLAIVPRAKGGEPRSRKIGLIVFVHHADDAGIEISSLNSARCLSRLMGCNLNAANFADHGFGAVKQLAESVPAISLRYGSYDQLTGVADQLFRLILSNGWSQSETNRLLSAFGGSVDRRAEAFQPTTPEPKTFPIPAPTKKRSAQKLTIGMATYDDFDGVYFTIQALRMFHAEAMHDVEFLVVDNRPDGPCGAPLKALENSIENYRYVPFLNSTGTMIRDAVFRETDSPYVLCIDCHVLISAGGIARLLDYYREHPDCPDLLQGPLIFDDLATLATHFDPTWRDGLYGRWADRKSPAELETESFEIPMQGLGLFSCRRDAWPGFNPAFRGFGGEEGYIHEKFRQAGARTLCLPFLSWLHRFPRPMGIPYPNRWEDRIRNYLIGFSELGLPTTEMERHFKEHLGEAAADRIIAHARQELRHMESDLTDSRTGPVDTDSAG